MYDLVMQCTQKDISAKKGGNGAVEPPDKVREKGAQRNMQGIRRGQ
jgi:hypothetical protein